MHNAQVQITACSECVSVCLIFLLLHLEKQFFKIKMLKNMEATVSNQFVPPKRGQRWIIGNTVCETGMSKALSSFMHLSL